jgi:hypothetical protein
MRNKKKGQSQMNITLAIIQLLAKMRIIITTIYSQNGTNNNPRAMAWAVGFGFAES